MTIDQFLAFLQLATLFKLFLLVLAFFYLIFAIVIYRQISLMSQVLNSKLSPIVKSIALLHIAAVSVLFVLVVLLA